MTTDHCAVRDRLRGRRALLLLAALLLAGCVGAPEGITPVAGFELERYLGRWYEIARLDHRFERGLERITAEYERREDGGVRVINRGYDVKGGVWRSAEGRAYFVDSPDVGHLKVSFFGPFYGAYVIFELDPAYGYAFVTGPNRDYLWLLAREPEPPQALVDRFVERARALGFETDALIFVDHSPAPKGGQFD